MIDYPMLMFAIAVLIILAIIDWYINLPPGGPSNYV